MATLDSAAVFELRLKQLKLHDRLAAFKAIGVTTFADLAYACSFTPGQPDESAFVAEVLQKVLEKDDARGPSVRRLYYEAFTMANAALQSWATKSADEPPKKLPQAERAVRFEELRSKLAGIVELQGELEPSSHLVDLVVQIVDESTLRYVHWEECAKRDSEVLGHRKETLWKPDGTGAIRALQVEKPEKADVSTDLLLRNALARRSEAFHMGRLCSFESHEQYVNLLFAEYMRSPRSATARTPSSSSSGRIRRSFVSWQRIRGPAWWRTQPRGPSR